MAEHQLTCAGCGAQFTYHRRKEYCTPRCRPGLRPKGTVRHENAACRQEHECSWCCEVFTPKRAGRTKYCSRACYFDRKRAERLVGRVYVRTSIKPKNKAPHDHPPTPSWCQHCGAGYYRTQKYQRYCDPECGAAERKDTKRKNDKAAKAAREARKRGVGVVESIDPLKVFERDAWRCAICGRKTDKKKRGTYHSKAPELDHIVALANGGTHTWDNVQCSCRACNGAKGASDYGQIPLFARA